MEIQHMNVRVPPLVDIRATAMGMPLMRVWVPPLVDQAADAKEGLPPMRAQIPPLVDQTANAMGVPPMRVWVLPLVERGANVLGLPPMVVRTPSLVDRRANATGEWSMAVRGLKFKPGLIVRLPPLLVVVKVLSMERIRIKTPALSEVVMVPTAQSEFRCVGIGTLQPSPMT